MSETAATISRKVQALADPVQAGQLQRFFKTGPGEYGEGDLFLGIRVPVLRALARSLGDTPLDELVRLLASAFHEERMLALLMLVHRFGLAKDEVEQEQIYHLYLANSRFINNWDLVDLSAPQIVGGFLYGRDRTPLYRLIGSVSLWERRIAVVATAHFIRKGEVQETLALGERVLDDPEELIHKATGWMLREVGKQSQPALEEFLLQHYRRMPRVMLRYAIERFPEPLRQRYLKGQA